MNRGPDSICETLRLRVVQHNSKINGIWLQLSDRACCFFFSSLPFSLDNDRNIEAGKSRNRRLESSPSKILPQKGTERSPIKLGSVEANISI